MKTRTTTLSIRRGKLKVDAMSAKTRRNLPRRKRKHLAAAALLAAAREGEKVIVHCDE